MRGDWRCEVYGTSADPRTCFRRTTLTATAPYARTHLRAVAASVESQVCEAKKIGTVDATTSSEQINAVLTHTSTAETAAEREREAARKAFDARLTKRTPLARKLWNGFWGIRE
jgi:hypothetical protein